MRGQGNGQQPWRQQSTCAPAPSRDVPYTTSKTPQVASRRQHQDHVARKTAQDRRTEVQVFRHFVQKSSAEDAPRPPAPPQGGGLSPISRLWYTRGSDRCPSCRHASRSNRLQASPTRFRSRQRTMQQLHIETKQIIKTLRLLAEKQEPEGGSWYEYRDGGCMRG